MTESSDHTPASNGTKTKGLRMSDLEAFTSTRKAFKELEAMGISEFQFFNALADLFHSRKEPEVSSLMAEAAYKFFLKD